MNKNLFFLFLLLVSSSPLFGQGRLEIIETKLTELAQTNPGLNEKVELSVNDVSIQEFIRGLANANNLNINVDPSLNTKIVSNFSGVCCIIYGTIELFQLSHILYF